jgi:redox-sensitive bicupin YhaK (pirin superfamily)
LAPWNDAEVTGLPLDISGSYLTVDGQPFGEAIPIWRNFVAHHQEELAVANQDGQKKARCAFEVVT